MKLLMLLVLVICGISIIGCSRVIPQVAKNVVLKTYVVLEKADMVIQNINVDNVIETSKKLELPLNVTKIALNLLNQKINNPDVNIELEKALINVDTMLELLKDVNKDNLEHLKTELTILVVELKSGIEMAAKAINVELPITKSSATSSEECMNELDKAVKLLQETVK